MVKRILFFLCFLVTVGVFAQAYKEDPIKLKKLAKKGQPKDMYKYAEYLLRNKPNGLKKDLEVALTYYEKAAKHDYIPALMALADFWVTSEEEEHIYLGLKYLIEACDNLYPTACEILQKMDYEEAKKGITPKFRDYLWDEFESHKDPYLKPNRYKVVRDLYRKGKEE
ncbi:sel1 repeat family protein [Capnocytophaga sp. oral taxon 878]|uniref:sel1 repeat family protein n=1 Tax=Capnocytophaga sp. oral taxon 878 TaxID=1316596 RepID=UPI000D03A5DD|nr:sel1 repeat family protein [Capnocytophaga sp. oral taxon 878]AVM49103.1 hypothetical protein C4H12_00675 [Capnocytophaga sp. oral taxon 878]